VGEMTALDDWIGRVCAELEIDDAGAQRNLVLDLARDVAHGVMRPAAPLTAYLVGIAVGRGADPAIAARTIAALARDWTGVPDDQGS